MNKLGALLFAAVAAQALPVNAQDASRTAPSPSAQANASQTPNDAADSDATGSIGKGGQPAVTASPADAGRAAPAQGQGKPPVTYAEAFRNWRTLRGAASNRRQSTAAMRAATPRAEAGDRLAAPL